MNKNHNNIALSDMMCFICQDYFCLPYTTSCGHTFCKYCLDEYFLYAKVMIEVSRSVLVAQLRSEENQFTES